MQIAQVLAGYSLGDADNLRRAMGKKDPVKMQKERERFIAGAGQTGIAERQAGEIFDQMETFAMYGFNKSHSAAYALVSFQTAYLKAHYPEEFMAGLLSMEMSDTDKTFKNIAECRERGIRILPPDVNESREDFTVPGAGRRQRSAPDPLRPLRRALARRQQGSRRHPRHPRMIKVTPAFLGFRPRKRVLVARLDASGGDESTGPGCGGAAPYRIADHAAPSDSSTVAVRR